MSGGFIWVKVLKCEPSPAARGYLERWPKSPHVVIPAKAGIHHLCSRFSPSPQFKIDGQVLDSRLRGNDEIIIFERVASLMSTGPKAWLMP
jgi:hypothetical protein